MEKITVKVGKKKEKKKGTGSHQYPKLLGTTSLKNVTLFSG